LRFVDSLLIIFVLSVNNVTGIKGFCLQEKSVVIEINERLSSFFMHIDFTGGTQTSCNLPVHERLAL